MTSTENLTGSYTTKSGRLITVAQDRYGYQIIMSTGVLAIGQSHKSTLAFLRGAGA